MSVASSLEAVRRIYSKTPCWEFRPRSLKSGDWKNARSQDYKRFPLKSAEFLRFYFVMCTSIYSSFTNTIYLNRNVRGSVVANFASGLPSGVSFRSLTNSVVSTFFSFLLRRAHISPIFVIGFCNFQAFTMYMSHLLFSRIVNTWQKCPPLCLVWCTDLHWLGESLSGEAEHEHRHHWPAGRSLLGGSSCRPHPSRQ